MLCQLQFSEPLKGHLLAFAIKVGDVLCLNKRKCSNTRDLGKKRNIACKDNAKEKYIKMKTRTKICRMYR